MFGLVGLVLLYKAVITNTESRSHAAETQSIYKQWEFNAKDAEGWTVVSPSAGVVEHGSYAITINKSTSPIVRNTTVETNLPYGMKTVSLSMSVGTAQTSGKVENPACPHIPNCSGTLIQQKSVSNCPIYKCITMTKHDEELTKEDAEHFTQSIEAMHACPEDTRTCADGTLVTRTLPHCQFASCPTNRKTMHFQKRPARTFTGLVYYRLKDKNKYEQPVAFNGVVAQGFKTYNVKLPDIATIDITALRIVFTSGLKAGEVVTIDWIRLLGVVHASSTGGHTPSPTISPVSHKQGVSSCTGLDGTACQLDGCEACPAGKPCPMVCRPRFGTCQNHQCVENKAPNGCHYEQARCVRAPCNPIIVCPSFPPPRHEQGV